MANKILIDTNVLLDYLLEREPFFEDAKGIMVSCAEGKARGLLEIIRKLHINKRSTESSQPGI